MKKNFFILASIIIIILIYTLNNNYYSINIPNLNISASDNTITSKIAYSDYDLNLGKKFLIKKESTLKVKKDSFVNLRFEEVPDFFSIIVSFEVRGTTPTTSASSTIITCIVVGDII